MQFLGIQLDGIHFFLVGEERILHFYGIALMLGAVLGAFLATHEARRRDEDPETVWDLLVWLLIGGIIGARLWHVFTPPPTSIAQGLTTAYYLTHPDSLIAVWNGGLGIPGAVIGGLITLYLFSRKYHIDFTKWADIIVPSLALGQAVGRWGNFFNQELYGSPTDLPWKLFIDPAHRLPGFQDIAYYHPLFLYEAIWNLGNMALLLWLARRYGQRLLGGDLVLVYMIVYPVGRFLLDFLRLDASQIAGINANQTLMAVVAVCSALALFIRHRAKRSGGTE